MIPWELISAALGALFWVGAVIAAYAYLNALSERLIASQNALAREQDAHAATRARAGALERRHAALLDELETVKEINRRLQDKHPEPSR